MSKKSLPLQDSIFAYCFECPRGVQIHTPAYYPTYNNIYSIVNYADVVPKVAPGDDTVIDVASEDWNYGRYGITYYLPAAELKSNFLLSYAREVAEYSKILSRTSLGSGNDAYQYSTLGIAQGAIEDKVVSAMAWLFKTPSVYSVNAQNTMRGIGKSMGEQHVVSVGDVLKAVLSTYLPAQVPILSAGSYFTKIGYAHYPELCLAWLDAIEGNWEYCDDTRTRKLVINCPVNVYVYDSSEKLVAEISWDEVKEIYNSTIAAYIDENGQKIIILPVDEEYEIEIVATDDGTVTYTVEEIDVDEVAPARVVSYCEVEVEEWDTLIGTVEALTEVGEAEYSLVIEDGKELIPDVDVSGSEAAQHTVTVLADEGGTVTGGGIFVTGEFAQVTATPDDGAEFIGWYNGEELESDEAEYRFLVTEDVTLTAKFGKATVNDIVLSETDLTMRVGNTKTLKASDSEGNAVDVVWNSSNDEVALVNEKGIVTARKAGKATITANFDGASASCEVLVRFNDVTDSTRSFYEPVYWALDNGITTGTSNTTFSPNNSCTRAQIVTFLWRLKGCPEPKSMKSPFTDVTNPEASYYKPVLWALENGITTGTSKTTFSPTKACTRAQCVTFLWRALGCPEPSTQTSPFKDVTNRNSSFYKPVLWALENGITTGTSKTTFSPNNTCTRGQIVTFLYRYNNLGH